MTRRGLTLMELFVVIAIIAIIAAILLPVIARAREKARQSSCLSNVKQINLSVNMYVQDYDETMPLGVAGMPPGAIYLTYELLDPYIKNTQVWECPSKTNPVNLSALGKRSIGYMFDVDTPTPSGNYRLFAIPALGYIPCSLAQIQSPAEVALMADAVGSVDATFTSTIVEDDRHNDGCNYGFADGHAKWDRPERVSIDFQ